MELDDPCPDDPRNSCFGPVAVDGTTGNAIRLNAYSKASSPAECAGTKVDCNGDTWLGDFGFNQQTEAFACNFNGGGESCVISGIGTIFGCDDESTEDLFQCEHFDAPTEPELSYSFDVSDGTYLVNLLFAEAFDGLPNVGDRIFDILIEGAVVYDDFDQVAAAGAAATAVVRSAVVTVADGNGITIELQHVVENPAIKAIEVLAEQPF